MHILDKKIIKKKKRLHTKTMFVPKVQLFQLVYLFVNSILPDKHGTKNL